MDNKSLKQLSAETALKIAAVVAPHKDDYIGLGTGSTADYFTKALAQAFKSGNMVPRAICTTSYPTTFLAQELGLNILTAIPACGLKLVVDGADEVDITTGAVIKGGGAAVFAEKDAARASLQNGGEYIIIVDESKVSEKLGSRFVYGVPVHIRPATKLLTCKALKENFDADIVVREAIVPKDLDKEVSVSNAKSGCYGPLFSREGDLIIDVRFNDSIPLDFNERALALPGVTGTGLLANQDTPTRVIIAARDGIKEVITPLGKKRGCKALL